ncbi:MAG TPA: hypothetical protein VJM69_00485, partial [Dehalococcoidia bacterium]|nr:hypothetical protein [Dehalococcoidia bacterium]
DFRSHKVRAKVPPGFLQELEITDRVPVPPGSYELSVWVHVVGQDGASPSDGAWFAKEISVR